MDYEKVLEDYFITSKGISYDDFFNPKRPFIQNLDVAVKRIRNLINKGATFRIIGDYDVDGICASEIMKTGLLNAGAKHVAVRLPDRFTDGYGMKTYMADETSEDIIITVDNGITAHEAVARAKQLGKEVIVIDHHEPTVKDGQIILPDADIIIDHKVYKGCDNDFCGAGLALQVVEYLIGNKPWLINKCYIFAALATIADVVNVTHWNRKIIQHGIACLNTNTDIPMGIKKVLEHLNLSTVDANTLAFRVCPVINAPGRMISHGADFALSLLEAKTWDEATSLKDKAMELNIKRREETEIGVENANALIERECLYGEIMPIFLDNIGEGILGIIAGRINESYNNTVGVFSETVNEKGVRIYKGSFRSKGINIKAVLDEVNKSGTILGYGGHEGAAGISVLAENKVSFMLALMNLDLEPFYVSKTAEEQAEPIEVKVDELENFYGTLQLYEPFGAGNKPPKVTIPDMELYPRNGALFSLLGTDGVKLFGKGFSAVGFGKYQDYQELGEPKKVRVTGNIRKSYYGKSSEIQLEFDELEAVKTEVNDETSLAKALRERMSFL